MLEEDEQFVFMLQMPDIQPRTFDPNIPRFELDLLSDEQARNQFRFYKDDIIRLKHALQIPERIILQNRSVVSGTDALCILLRRFAYPNRFSDLERIFGRPNTTLSIVVNTLLEHIHDYFRHVVTEFDQAWMDQRHIQIYADTIHEKRAPLTNCFGFVDGTVRPICRPTRYQRVCYNGHKRIHSLKFQSVMLQFR
ncbi:hypothetical protein LOTGIDRAFT_113508 [Lottia gigantea]|uniref:DDE Tnp4 domain-containing protein n=1 Tax=Lottia gigantea TaxID=225164 RepID=V4CC49_LOTGI|nr:hypothetical protein LOTGIDRAFT_113508 [Lottia gigantea]ESO99449.1 hypothetical protein LOTGIDRAFT_113508 [Lottia gigantea]